FFAHPSNILDILIETQYNRFNKILLIQVYNIKMPLKQVYKPENELMAMSIKSLLEQSGIPVVLRSYQIPWYNGIAKMMRPAWGEILVDEEDYEQALEIVQNFLASETDSDVSQNDTEAKEEN
ncbi:MAG: DUF2007 domain-containing protein, partial [candidate division WOR-3 bacterium]|nr:DUF2007 domain-containing protein [candidate division WOR-3 bacterium]